MTEPRSVVVVGGGLAAAKATGGLREGGFADGITLIGEEHEAPYERPPLSKGYLTGTEQRDSLFAHPPGWYAEHDVELVLGTPVTGIDLASRTVTTAGRAFGYDRLLLATGATPRRLPSAPAGETVGYLRTIADSERVRAALRPGHRIAVIGGGWIGLEVAAAARTAGCDVVVVAMVVVGTPLGHDAHPGAHRTTPGRIVTSSSNRPERGCRADVDHDRLQEDSGRLPGPERRVPGPGRAGDALPDDRWPR